MRIRVVTKKSMRVLQVSRVTTIAGMSKTFAGAFMMVAAYMARKNVKCEFAPFGLYKEIDWDAVKKPNPIIRFFTMPFKKWKVDIGFPVLKNVPGDGEIVSAELPAGKYLEVLHKGPYQTVGKTYQEICVFAEKEHFRLKDFAVESYLNDPKTVKPENLQTRIAVAVD